MTSPLSSEGYTRHNSVRLLRGGQPYFDAMLELINAAASTIHLQVYIFEKDETGRRIVDALLNAASRKVAVYLLLDAYGSQQFSRQWVAEVKAAGIHFRWFEPLLRASHFYFGRRLHHKVMVVDGDKALVGGVNISNRYNDLPENHAWLDWAVLTGGEAARQLNTICFNIFNKAGWGKKKNRNYRPAPVEGKAKGDQLVRVRREDWVRSKSEISRSYLSMLASAEEEVVLLSSYFLPGPQMRRALARAAQRGVIVKVIAAGKSDVWLAKAAERYLYRWLLKNNIRLFEYQANILHGKISTADCRWTTVGSYNVNFISAFASIELNLEILDDQFAVSLKQQLDTVIAEDCVPITSENWLSREHLGQRIMQKLAYETVRLIFFVFTFYFRQGK
ncbi:phospholipase D-like domain-containing protein [Flavihumibacter petaseus]|uniref:Putative cardiolipin synthase n=1 Tax=Flavihumibacter petaseus NBRC 106054 TaxID=1220578 RepID=A0A0E9MVV4_9BACT|nr:phospholipase D-like domain-containing protein [Flavihumibacter petaseus]GAO41260.1 putative cardiolipin synthase [Flavihumibacter petaseus NBRC 106054]